MFCKKCGYQIETNAKFCPKCGTPVYVSDSSKSILEKVKENIVRHKASYSVIVIVLIVGGIVFHMLFGGSSNTYEAPIQTMMTAIEKQDTKKYVKVFPPEILTRTKDELGLDMETYIENNVFSLFTGEVKINYEIKSIQNYTTDEIDSIINKIDRYTTIALDITEAKKVKISMTVQMDGEMDTEDLSLNVIKVSGKWYIDPTTFL